MKNKYAMQILDKLWDYIRENYIMVKHEYPRRDIEDMMRRYYSFQKWAAVEYFYALCTSNASTPTEMYLVSDFFIKQMDRYSTTAPEKYMFSVAYDVAVDLHLKVIAM